ADLELTLAADEAQPDDTVLAVALDEKAYEKGIEAVDRLASCRRNAADIEMVGPEGDHLEADPDPERAREGPMKQGYVEPQKADDGPGAHGEKGEAGNGGKPGGQRHDPADALPVHGAVGGKLDSKERIGLHCVDLAR